MRRLLLLPLAAAAALLISAAAGADTKSVQITKNGFTPATQTVTAGDTITWHNADSADHQVVADDGSFASPVLKPDASYSYTFQKAGKFAYHDADAKTHRGTVTVNASPASIALTTSQALIGYGANVTVSGTVTGQVTTEPVTLTCTPSCGVKSTTTSSNGNFSFDVTPTVQTSYVAHWRTADSQPVTVKVAPRVGFGLSGRLYTAKVTSDIGYEGHFVWVQRRSIVGAWHSVKRVYLGASSNARFAVKLPRGRSYLRLNLPAGQAGAGYVASMSRTIAVRR